MENITAYDLAIIAGGFTIVGALIGALVAFWLSINLNDRQNRSIAISNFRAAFAPLISQMALAQETTTIDKRAILNDTFKSISVAIEVFRPYVRSCEQEAYQKAWSDYYSTGFNGQVHFMQYTIEGEINGEKKEPYKLFIQRVNHILSFAKP